MRVVAPLVAAACLALIAAVAWVAARTPDSVLTGAAPVVRAPTPSQSGTVTVTIQKGDSPGTAGERLQSAGVIQSAQQFRVLAALEGVGSDLIAGDYEFDRGIPALEAIDRIHRGVTAPLQVTITEGLRAEEIADLLESKGVVQRGAFLDALDHGSYDLPFLQQLTPPASGQAAGQTRLEGFLFPATYAFSHNMNPQEVVSRLLQGFQDGVASKISVSGSGLNLEEAVTLASIVEREAAVASERPTIASVFLNRMHAGLPLQADPTVQYVLGGDPDSVRKYGYWKQGLSEADLQVDSPYNTYVNVGLPPGPIDSPGLASIQAVLDPAQTNYLFFVAKPDGTHAFAETLEEHQRNVQQYQGTSP